MPFQILQIFTPFAVLDLSTLAQSSWEARTDTSAPVRAHLSVETSTGQPTAIWTDSDGTTHHWTAGQPGPPFFEDVPYQFRARSLVPGKAPDIQHRDPNLLRRLVYYGDDTTWVGPFNFERQAGRSRFDIYVGNHLLRVEIEVFPTKIDYERDYLALLSEVSSAARGLALEYLRATYHSGLAVQSQETTTLEWITLLRNEIESLDASMRYVNSHPIRTLAQMPEVTRVDKIKRVDVSSRRSILRGKGYGASQNVPGIGTVHNLIPAIRGRESLDTAEHRWLRLNLALVSARVSELHSSIEAEIQNAERSGRSASQRLRAESREIDRFSAVLQDLLALPVFEGVLSAPPSGFTSLTLLTGTGYRDTYRSLSILRLGLDIDKGDPELAVMDLHDLYEAWCFLALVTMVSSVVGGVANLGSMVQVEARGIRVRLQRGARSSAEFLVGGRTLIVAYNVQYSGLTGDQRPDIVLTFRQDGWPDLIVVFDAKYRLDVSERYRNQFGSAGPPQEAINALHRYRDAIVVDSLADGKQRPVVKGVALFPLSTQGSGRYMSSKLPVALEVLGIGAVPFLPDNQSLVENWLTKLLALTPEQLAEPGPPFAGLAELTRRSAATMTTIDPG